MISRMVPKHTNGVSVAEICVALGLSGILVCLALPSFNRWLDGVRLGAASRRMTTLFQELRYRAVHQSKCCGIMFVSDPDSDSVHFLVAEDGDGDGLRRAEIEEGTDPVIEGPCRLETGYGGVRFGIIEGEQIPVLPPGSGSISNPADPIRFGSSDIASFTPRGTSSSGTVYLCSPRGRMRAVRLYGVTGRIQLWDYLPERGEWVRR